MGREGDLIAVRDAPLVHNLAKKYMEDAVGSGDGDASQTSMASFLLSPLLRDQVMRVEGEYAEPVAVMEKLIKSAPTPARSEWELSSSYCSDTTLRYTNDDDLGEGDGGNKDQQFILSIRSCEEYFSSRQCLHWSRVLSSPSVKKSLLHQQLGSALTLHYPSNNSIVTSTSIDLGLSGWVFSPRLATMLNMTLCMTYGVSSMCAPFREELFRSIRVNDLHAGTHYIEVSVGCSGEDGTVGTTGHDNFQVVAKSSSYFTVQDRGALFAGFGEGFSKYFNMSNCNGGRSGWGGIYVYPYVKHNIHDYFIELLKFNKVAQHAFGYLIEALKKLPDYTTNPDTACLLVPSIDTLCLHSECILRRQTSNYLAQLPYWDGGRNHVLFYADDKPEIPFDSGMSVHARSSVRLNSLSLLDSTFPLAWYVCSYKEETVFDHLHRFDSYSYSSTVEEGSDRPTLLSFKGARYDSFKYPAVYDRERLRPLHNGRDIVIALYCSTVNNFCCKEGGTDCGTPVNFAVDDMCEADEANSRRYDYGHLLHSSTFCIVAPGAGYHSYRLYEVLQAGCIPVVVGDSALPFEGVASPITWSRIAVRLDERKHSLDELPALLHSITLKERVEMRKAGKAAFHRHFSSIDNMIETFATLMAARLQVLATDMNRQGETRQNRHGV